MGEIDSAPSLPSLTSRGVVADSSLARMERWKHSRLRYVVRSPAELEGSFDTLARTSCERGS